MVDVMIYDRPCGTGKTSEMLESFLHKEKYLVIVPFLTEIDRVLEHTANTDHQFFSPTTDENDFESKYESLKALLEEGKNVVATHNLFYAIKDLADCQLLQKYNVILDEVPNVIEDVSGLVKPDTFKQIYFDGGFVEVSQDGLITPTEKWSGQVSALDDGLKKRVYSLAAGRRLYQKDGKFFIKILPPELFTSCKSLTILTYLAANSMLKAYFKRMGITYARIDNRFDEAAFKANARKLISLETISSLEKYNFSYSGQQKMTAEDKRNVGEALNNFKRKKLKDVPDKNVLITCSKDNWFNPKDEKKAAGFAVKSRMFKEANWIPNTTRGTNQYSHTSVLIYLYDQNPNPVVEKFLEVEGNFKNYYALSELIQWVYRSQVRKGLPIKLYIPSKRMRKLFEDWLNSD
jgi:hypothetical protein